MTPWKPCPHYHNCTHLDAGSCLEFKELQQCLMAIRYNEEYSQSDYNKEILSRQLRFSPFSIGCGISHARVLKIIPHTFRQLHQLLHEGIDVRSQLLLV